MSFKLTMLPLNSEGTLYVIRDEDGRTLGTGTRDVCEALIHIVNFPPSGLAPQDRTRPQQPHINVRAAISI